MSKYRKYIEHINGSGTEPESEDRYTAGYGISFSDVQSSDSQGSGSEDDGIDNQIGYINEAAENNADLEKTTYFKEKYEKIKTLGKGHFGTVVKARVKGTNEVVAIKHIHPKYAYQNYLLAEANILDTLDSEYVIKYLGRDSFLTPQLLALEYAENGSLLSLLKNKQSPLSYAEAVNYGAQITKGLAYLHLEDPETGKRAVIHADLNLGNFLVMKDGTVKISDFGCARFAHPTSNEDNTKIPLGLMNHFAPELLSGESPTTATDIWAFVCCLYTMLSGKTAFVLEDRNIPNAKAKEILRHKMVDKKESKKLPSGLPLKLNTVMRLCWHHNPESRPSAQTLVSCFDDMNKTKKETQKSSRCIVL